jgi:hypothetical protein
MNPNLFRVLAATTLTCACLAAQNAPPADDANEIDSQPSRVFRTTVRDALNREDFPQLENIAATVRADKSHFVGGVWKLNVFYLTVQGPGSLTDSDGVWKAHIARLERWRAAYPESITPRVALAQSYLRYAWKARGHGYSNTVTNEGWQQFRSRIQQARSILEESKSLSGNDPQWFHDMQTVALTQEWPRPQVDQLLEAAITAEPTYFYSYVVEANYLLPRWYGKPGEAEAFAQSIADRVGGQSGNFIYFRIAEAMNCCGAKNMLPALSWDRIKEGFTALEGLYGSINYQRNMMAYLALRNKDQEFASQMFSRIGDDWDQSVWKTKANFDGRIVIAPASTE